MAFTVVGILLVLAGILGFPLHKLKLWETTRKRRYDLENLESHLDGQLEIVHVEEWRPDELKVENCESSI